jgi:hypothetical protein
MTHKWSPLVLAMAAAGAPMGAGGATVLGSAFDVELTSTASPWGR